jgi:hypothetical protein
MLRVVKVYVNYIHCLDENKSITRVHGDSKDHQARSLLYLCEIFNIQHAAIWSVFGDRCLAQSGTQPRKRMCK